MFEVTTDYLNRLKNWKVEKLIVKVTMTKGKTWCGRYDYAFARVAGVNIAVSKLGSYKTRYASYCKEVLDHNGSNYVEDAGSNKWARVHIKEGAEFTIEVKTGTLSRTLSRINKFAEVMYVRCAD